MMESWRIMKMTNGPDREKEMNPQEFTLDFLLDLLSSKGFLNEEQRSQVVVKGEQARHRLRRDRSRSLDDRQVYYEVSPVEIAASFGFTFKEKDRERPLDEDIITETLAQHVGFPYEKIDPLKLDSHLISMTMSRPFARRHSVVPLREEQGMLVIAAADPFNKGLFEELRRITGREVRIVLSAKCDIQRVITEVYGFKTSVRAAVAEYSKWNDLGNLEQLVKLKKVEDIEATDRHVVNAVEYLLHYAFDQRASDIHLEPKREECRIRMRIDGVMHDIYRVPMAVHPAMVTRIKMLSRLDIAERRKPQDGRFKTSREGREVELRISILPVAFGEKVVIRLLDPQTLVQDLVDLGMDDNELDRWSTLIERPHGLLLVTGPTGSGKTTTLYSSLKTIATPEVNITTIEDPIEMVLEPLNQLAVHTKIDLTYAKALRSILRQDPDIIMVGEIRDRETADYAIQAALTGHLVLSTLHTNDTASSITRLFDLGINPYLISSTLIAVLAQRLLRCICPDCRVETHLTSDEIALLQIPMPEMGKKPLKVWKGEGCVKCRGTGLYGRTGVFELLEVKEQIQHMISQKRTAKEIARAATMDGMRTLRESAVAKLAQGLTSFGEVMRVTVEEEES